MATYNVNKISKDGNLYNLKDYRIPSVTSSDNGKTLQVVSGAWAAATPTGGLPSVTSADNGKVLRVVDGAWAAAELPSASGVSF